MALFHKDAIVEAFRLNGYRMTLGYILQHPWGYEFRARATELRREGWTIRCEKGRVPSENLYHAMPPEKSGQLRMAM